MGGCQLTDCHVTDQMGHVQMDRCLSGKRSCAASCFSDRTPLPPRGARDGPLCASRAFPALPAFFMAEVPAQRHLRAPQQRALHSPFSVVAVCAPDILFPESSFRSLVPALRADG